MVVNEVVVERKTVVNAMLCVLHLVLAWTKYCLSVLLELLLCNGFFFFFCLRLLGYF